MSRGFVLVEVTVAYLILALALTALIPVFILALRANKSTEQVQAATYLSAELLEEVRMRKWDHNMPSPAIHISTLSVTLGVDAGESASDKRTFDDIDDFNGWTEAQPVDPVMRALSAFTGYARSVVVSYVNADLSAAGAATDFKKVSVCTTPTKHDPICLDTVMTNH